MSIRFVHPLAKFQLSQSFWQLPVQPALTAYNPKCPYLVTTRSIQPFGQSSKEAYKRQRGSAIMITYVVREFYNGGTEAVYSDP